MMVNVKLMSQATTSEKLIITHSTITEWIA